MRRTTVKPWLATLALALSASAPSWAAEKAITLKVENMDCASCGPIVKRTLAKVQGVKNVAVNVATGTAAITFDDERTTATALSDATAKAGYPSRVVE
jgi:mercuric ion binding protein